MRWWLLALIAGMVFVGCGGEDESDVDVVGTQVAIAIAATADAQPTNTEVPTATDTPAPTATTTATAEPTATYTPVPTNTPRPTHTPRPTYTPMPTNTPAPTATPEPRAELAWMIPQDGEFGIAMELNTVERITTATPSSRFVFGEEYRWFPENFSLASEYFGIVSAKCVEYETFDQAAAWVDSRRASNRNIYVNITRDEQVPGIGDATYTLSGLFSSSGNIFTVGVAWLRIGQVACEYQALGEEVYPVDLMLDIAIRVAARVETQLGQ